MTRPIALHLLLSLCVVGACGPDDDAPPSDGDAADVTPGDADTSPDHDAAVDAVEDALPDTSQPPPGSELRGPHATGVALRTWADEARGRELPVNIWYPAVGDTSAQLDIGALIADADRRATYETLLASAPADCPSRTVTALLDAAAAPPPPSGWPVVVYSHCHDCLGLSGASVASYLASHGFVVLAPDHVGNTLFDGLAGASLPLNAETLAMRVADLGFVLDTAFGDVPERLPYLLDGQLDATRVGAVGHSFGAVSVSGLAASDARVDAVVPMGAPPESPLFPGVFLADIEAPMLLVVLTEDNSITEVGNTLMRDNFAAAATPIWKLEIVDAGHWSVSDLCGLSETYAPGCGEDTRQTNPRETFTYLPVAAGLQSASEWTTRFLRAMVLGEAQATAELSEPAPPGILLESRN